MECKIFFALWVDKASLKSINRKKDYSFNSRIMNKIILKEEIVAEKRFIVFRITGNKSFIKDHLLQMEEVRWGSKRKCLYMQRFRDDISSIFKHIAGHGFYLDYSALKDKKRKPGKRLTKAGPEKKPGTKKALPELNDYYKLYLRAFQNYMEQRRYSANTIKTYHQQLTKFFCYFRHKKVDEIEISDIEKFSHDYILKEGYSYSLQNQTISAIKLFYQKMLSTKLEFEHIERPRPAKKLPKVISKPDVKKLLLSTRNLKHKTALSVIYGLGLRRSELINLKLSDIYLKREVVIIRNAKGKKDRTLPLPQNLKELIIKYYHEYRPEIWLIEGQEHGTRYSETSLQKIFNKNLNRIKKSHSFTLHSLRHSYATHLHESGIDIRNIQELLGHKSSKTTEIYTHVSMRNLKNLSNPIDDFEL